MTIDWTQAPPWARYAAMDADGRWYWHESPPTADPFGYWDNCGQISEIEDQNPTRELALSSLTERPTE